MAQVFRHSRIGFEHVFPYPTGAGSVMSYPAYQNRVVDCTIPFDASSLKGKSVVLTGGASTMSTTYDMSGE